MTDNPQKLQNNDKAEVENLLLALMTVEDAPAPTPPSPTKTILDDLKPFPFHKGCGGLVQAQFGLNEEEMPVARFVCSKCHHEEIVEGTDVHPPEDGKPGPAPYPLRHG